MKKLAFMFVAVAAMSFASCGGQNQASTEAQDSTEVEEVVAEPDTTCACDTCACDTCTCGAE